MNVLRSRGGNGAAVNPADRAQQRPRTPGVAYSVVTVAVCILVGALALTSRQAPPPTIAEFAPQAVQQIADSSNDRAGAAGASSSEESRVDEAARNTDASRRSIDVARARRCVGDPPRQIEDPQSPPCVPYWEGDNGGATARGVSRDEIRVAAPPGFMAFGPAFERFFNSRFEFYGRKIRLIDTASDFSDCSAAGQESAAVAADEQRNVFATMSLVFACSSTTYNDAVARRGIISIDMQQHTTEPFLRSHSPYMWSYPMAMDGVQFMYADWACARFAGETAKYAKGPEALNRRVFGVIAHMNYSYQAPIDTAPLRRRLDRCGERSAATFELSGNMGPPYESGAPDQAGMYSNVLLQMREKGVSTIFCLCHVTVWGKFAATATSNGYFPEWLVGTYFLNDDDFWVRLFLTPEQRGQAMGLTFLPRQTNRANSPAFWAKADGDPASDSSRMRSGEDSTETIPYRSMLLLASGLQMAGPHLTPQTFEPGLHKTVFPNPDHPIKAGSVGFSDGDHSMTDDVAEYWWSNADRGPQSDDVGTICYVDGGDRRMLGRFAVGDVPFFKPPCDSGA